MASDLFSSGPAFPDSEEIRSASRSDPNYNLLAIASLVIGIFSLFSRTELLWELLAIVLGVCARKKCDRKWIATTGIVCGVLTLFFTLLVVFLFRQVGHPGP